MKLVTTHHSTTPEKPEGIEKEKTKKRKQTSIQQFAQLDVTGGETTTTTTTTSTTPSSKKKKESEDGTPSKRKKTAKEPVAKKALAVPTDKDGNVLFPIILGVLTIHDLGHVVWDRPAFHSDRYIWPVGFRSCRMYASVKDPDRRCSYMCEILDGGEVPEFVVTPEDDPDNPAKGTSATSAWEKILKRVNELKTEETGKRLYTAVSGPEYFGFGNPTIAKLIQDLPGADKCEKYVRKTFAGPGDDADGEHHTPTPKKTRAKKEAPAPLPLPPPPAPVDAPADAPVDQIMDDDDDFKAAPPPPQPTPPRKIALIIKGDKIALTREKKENSHDENGNGNSTPKASENPLKKPKKEAIDVPSTTTSEEDALKALYQKKQAPGSPSPTKSHTQSTLTPTLGITTAQTNTNTPTSPQREKKKVPLSLSQQKEEKENITVDPQSFT